MNWFKKEKENKIQKEKLGILLNEDDQVLPDFSKPIFFTLTFKDGETVNTPKLKWFGPIPNDDNASRYYDQSIIKDFYAFCRYTYTTSVPKELIEFQVVFYDRTLGLVRVKGTDHKLGKYPSFNLEYKGSFKNLTNEQKKELGVYSQYISKE